MTTMEHLFTPLQIGRMTTKNRLLMSAMSINFGVDDQGHVTDQLSAYFVERAKGGVGMMLVGGGAVDPSGLELPDLPALWDDSCIPALERMVAAVKPYDCRFGVQLMHGGRQSYHDGKVAPSPIPAPAVVKGIPKELDLEEIGQLVDAFGSAAGRCQQAGFEFVEIHGAHGYLINQFLAPNSNRRTDHYGGTFENRSRFLREIIKAIQTRCGSDFPVGVRINGEDYIDNGFGLEESLQLAEILESDGAAYLHVSAGVYGSTQLTIPSMYVDQGCFIHLAEAVKQRVNIPVVAVGRIKSGEMAEAVVATGQADMVALGRSLLADPHWPLKVKTGQSRFIRPCIGCCLGCIHAVLQLEPGGCVVNPDVGREHLLNADENAAAPKRVLIVGAGPAGLAAARMAAMRGHQVSVCDQGRWVGGTLRLAAAVPGRRELGEIIRFFSEEAERLGVSVHLHTPLSSEFIEKMDPQVIIMATGCLPDMPMVRGLSKTQMEIITAHEVLDGDLPEGDRVVVLGGDQAGLLVADFLADRNRRVIVLHRGAHFATEMSSNDRFYLRERLKQQPVELLKRVVIDNFETDGVRVRMDGQARYIRGYDALVLADAMVSLREAANLLPEMDLEVHWIGDARKPRHVMYAVADGEEVGRQI